MASQLESLIQENSVWPPSTEAERIDNYEKNLKLLLGKHSEVFTLRSKPTDEVIQSSLKFFNAFFGGEAFTSAGDIRVSLPIPIPLIIAMIYSDLLFSSPISPTMKTKTQQQTVEDIIDRSDLHSLNLEQAMICSILGDCVYEVRLNEGQAFIGFIDPKQFIPIWNKNDRNKLDEGAVFWKTTVGDDVFCTFKVFSRVGNSIKLERSIWSMKGEKLDGRLPWNPKIQEAPEVETIELDEIPLVLIPNIRLGGNFGFSDIGFGVDALIDELDNRLSQQSTILDRHADPAIIGPETLIDPETGKVDRKSGFIPYETAGVKPEYMTWNGELLAAESFVNRLLTITAVATGIPPSILMEQIQGTELSAKRLRLEFFQAVNRAGRKRLNFDRGLKRLLTIAQKMETGSGGEVESIVDLNWKDGLPDDPMDSVTIQGKRVADGTQSRVGAIMELDECSESEAREKLDQITEDENATTKATVEAMEPNRNRDKTLGT